KEHREVPPAEGRRHPGLPRGGHTAVQRPHLRPGPAPPAALRGLSFGPSVVLWDNGRAEILSRRLMTEAPPATIIGQWGRGRPRYCLRGGKRYEKTQR